MVHSGMIGITELMTDDRFLGWMEEQKDELLASLSTFEIYSLYRNQREEFVN